MKSAAWRNSSRRRALSQRRSSALTGIPSRRKIFFAPRTCSLLAGRKMLANFVAPYDAYVIERFKPDGRV